MVAWEAEFPLKSRGSGRGHALSFSRPLFSEAQGQGSGGIRTGAFCSRRGPDLPIGQGEEGSGQDLMEGPPRGFDGPPASGLIPQGRVSPLFHLSSCPSLTPFCRPTVSLGRAWCWWLRKLEVRKALQTHQGGRLQSMGVMPFARLLGLSASVSPTLLPKRDLTSPCGFIQIPDNPHSLSPSRPPGKI